MEADAKVRDHHLAAQAEEEYRRWESAVESSLSKADKELEERRQEADRKRWESPLVKAERALSE